MSFVGLQSLPPHWGEVKLKWESSRYAGGTPSRENLSFWGGDIPWLGSGEVNQVTVTLPTECISEEGLASSSAKWVPKGSLVMALAGQGKTKGMVARMGIDATCNQSLAAIVPQDLRLAGYIFWWLTSCYQDIRNLAGGDGRDGLNLELIGNIRMPAPPRDEQIAIAAFLDHETGKIDDLISEQEQLIALLDEKRQAVISHAVTKGLDPDVEMKDSRIEWLGEVPAHWQIAKTKRHFSNQKEINHGMVCDNRLALTMNGVVRRRLDDSEGLQSSSYDGYQIFNPGDLVFKLIDLENIRTSRVGIVPETGIMSPAYIRMVSNGQCVSEFGYWYFTALYWQKVYNGLGGGIRQSLGPSDLGEMELPLPPHHEQKEIAGYLQAQADSTKALITSCNEAISLLKERRSALISAAVTGKIDVRNHPAAVAALNENKDS